MALAIMYGRVADKCQQQWNRVAKPVAQAKQGVAEIANGIKKLGNYSEGLKQIKEGVKHIFGATTKQKHARLADQALVAYPNDNYSRAVRQLILNQLGYQANLQITAGGMDISKQDVFTPDMIAKIYQRMAAPNFVGVQPMCGPVGRVYALELEGEPSDSEMPGRRINFQIVSHDVSAMSRSLHAHFGTTIGEIPTLHGGADIKTIVQDALSFEIANQLDQEVLTNIGILAEDGGVVTPSMDGKFAVELNKHCNDIARKSRRGVANFMVLSPMAATYLISSAGKAFVPTETDPNPLASIQLVGMLHGSIKVYQNLFASADILIGYKGTGDSLDSGAFFCPYVPVITIGTTIDPATFEPVTRLATRFGFTHNSEQSSRYYTKLTIGEPFPVPTPSWSEDV